MAKILFAEDDAYLGQQVRDALEVDGHIIEWVPNGREANDRLRLYSYDLAILDWNLPEMSGFEICTDMRARNNSIPVLILTAKSALESKVDALERGADDYLTKPFAMLELQARVKALSRRPKQGGNPVLQVADLWLDLSTRQARRNNREISLLPKEFAVLEFLMRQPDVSFSATELLERVWSSESDSGEDAVRQCIARMRKKLNGSDDPFPILVGEKGFGYRIVRAQK